MTRPLQAAALFLAVSLLGGCAATTDRSVAAAPGDGERAALAATFRHLFDNNASALQRGAATYCIGIGDRPNLSDPAPDLIAALADVQPRIAAASACRIGDRVVDANGRTALLFALRTITCRSRDDCLFEGGYYEGNLSASAGRYHARRAGSGWRIASEGPTAIS